MSPPGTGRPAGAPLTGHTPALEQPNDAYQNHSADERDDDLCDDAAGMEAEQHADDEAADDRAEQPEHQIEDDPVAGVHRQICEPAGDEPHDDPTNDRTYHLRTSPFLRLLRLPLPSRS